jgi:hypothetical protein
MQIPGLNDVNVRLTFFLSLRFFLLVQLVSIDRDGDDVNIDIGF